MGGATGTKNPTRLLPQAGYTESVLEDTYLPTESFVVSDFAQHAFRVGYTPGVEDATLLASSSSSVPLNLSPPPPILTDADLRNHPLKSIRSISTADEPSRKKFMTEQKLRNKHAQVTDKLVNNDQDVALIVAPERPLLQPLLQPPAQPLLEPPRSSAAAPSSSSAGAASSSSSAAVGPVLLQISFYHGCKKLRVFEVHSNQTLLELRDAMASVCVSTKVIAYQRAEIERTTGSDCAVPSDGAAFCIDGAWFHCGERDPSAEARAWLESRGLRQQQPARHMRDVTFGQLKLRLGAQYLFAHYGDCEHDFVVTRCTLRHTSDTHDASAYPRTIWKRQDAAGLCTICNTHTAVWDVHGDLHADVLPNQLCKRCHDEAYPPGRDQTGIKHYALIENVDNVGEAFPSDEPTEDAAAMPVAGMPTVVATLTADVADDDSLPITAIVVREP